MWLIWGEVVDCADRTHVLLERAQCGWRDPEVVDTLRGGVFVLLLLLLPVQMEYLITLKNRGIAGRNRGRLVPCQHRIASFLPL